MAEVYNDILHLQGHFEQRKNPGKPGARNIRSHSLIKVEHLIELKNNLLDVYNFWKDNKFLTKALVSVHYNDVVAKSNRIQKLLSEPGRVSNSSIVGAKFSDEGNHIITHFVDKQAILNSISNLEICISVMEQKFNGKLTTEAIDEINSNEWKIEEIKKTKFVSIIVDSFYVDKFAVDKRYENIKERSIVTLYKTNISIPTLFDQLGIAEGAYQIIDDTTIVLTPDQCSVLVANVPYLIAMDVSDISQLTRDVFLPEKNYDENYINEDPQFPALQPPTNEPVIGVIDTQFNTHVYFRDWVKYKNELSKNIEFEDKDYYHGTMVSSIIVDGPALNPRLEDNCGRFQVRHFGVATHRHSSASLIMRLIEKIVTNNKDIKVWNLSLGSELEISPNFVSPEAAVLDRLQYENDIVFVVSGTNKKDTDIDKQVKIGAPADSINSLIVNSVDFNKKPADYSREGPVLSFFNKPDVSYYGGTADDEINVYSSFGKRKAHGTSFAAPWITRKMAYLIYKMGLSKEVAKALIIDSAAGWTKNKEPSHIIGFGVVPKDINDIVKSKKDEIRFVFSESSEEFDTYNLNIPIPVYKGAQPFIAKATLCYFPKCSRNQGVDYTDTELDLHFGRVKDKKEIKCINNNLQSNTSPAFLKEESARKLYRKWDNIKVIGEEYKDGLRGRKLYDDGRWGISLKTKERLSGNAGKGLKFGVVITLKEINGVNRFDEFVHLCLLSGWIVNRVNVENQIDIYNKAEEDIEFE